MKLEENQNFSVAVITYKEALDSFANNDDIKALINKSKKSKMCRAEVYPGSLCISFCIPDKTNIIHKFPFLSIINHDRVLFIDDSGKVGYCIKNMQKNKVLNEDCLGRFIYDFLETLVEPELRYLDGFSDRISKMENAVVSGVFEQFDHKMIAVRKEILASYRYYSQLIDIGQELQENENGFFSEKDIHYFKHFTDRARQFHEETKTLREYTLQLREVYQTQFDMRQNKVMKVLTVVTTIFSPLTIIVGWYGMNFSNMPELTWEYGYLLVILLSILTTGFCIWILRQNKFL